jgi:RHS repeat-associated protein
LYNGKELQEETGNYDYGWRRYDPAIGRFFTQDRFSEKYYDFSPYQYAANNPIKFIDVNGDSLWIKSNDGQLLYENGTLYSKGNDGSLSEYKGKLAKLDKEGNVKRYKGILGTTVNSLLKFRSRISS